VTARPQLAGALHAAWGSGRTSRAELRASQDAALRRLALHAYDQVRYYHRLFDRYRLHPRHLRGVADLDLLPLSTRDDLRAQRAADLLARDTDLAALLRVPTAGAAGPALYRTWLEDLLQLLHRVRSLGGVGVQSRDRIAIVGAGDASARERHGLALHLLGLRRRRVFDGSQEPVAAALAVAAFQPDVIAGTPGMLDRLAAGGPAAAAIRPRLVVVEGTPPMPRLRARLGEAFDAPVRATYGLGAETLLGAECRETGAFHVSDGWVLLEVLADGRPALPGERGEVAVTLLHSYAMPILRYRLGHHATRGGPCACGAPYSTVLAPDV
jgi:phenylacetate-CoA ligase